MRLFAPVIFQCLGLSLFRAASVQRDRNENVSWELITTHTDFSFHVRDAHTYLRPYGDEFAVRGHRRFQPFTADNKIRAGQGHIYVYAHGCYATHRIITWTLIDLRVWSQMLNTMQIPCVPKDNRDQRGTGHIAYKIAAASKAVMGRFYIARDGYTAKPIDVRVTGDKILSDSILPQPAPLSPRQQHVLALQAKVDRAAAARAAKRDAERTHS